MGRTLHSSGKACLWLTRGAWLLAIVLGALQAAAHRFTISSEDGISYLDVADAYFRADWKSAINAYWSPLYSWLLGLALTVLRPSPYWEFPMVKLVNFISYLFALGAFEFLLTQLLHYERKSSKDSGKPDCGMPEWIWRLLGYTVFIWASLMWTTLRSDTPDMLTSGFVYLATGILVQVNTNGHSLVKSTLLGAVLGFAYLSKAPMFPISFAILILLFSVRKLRNRMPALLASLLAFAVVSMPFVIALSTAKNHLTFGESGKINYAVFVNPGAVQINDHYWQGEQQGFGTPRHPPRTIYDNPSVFEFATPVAGTYPVWYDPTYWLDGLKFKFDLRQQIEVAVRNIHIYYDTFLATLIFGYLILAFGAGSFWPSLYELKANWRLLAVALAGLTIYGIGTDLRLASLPDQPSTRFVAPFIVLAFAGTFSSLRVSASWKSRRIVAAITTAILLVVGAKIALNALHDLDILKSGKLPAADWQIAQGLKQLRLQPGEKIAHLGFKNYYWARLARLRIVAEIPDELNFWNGDAAHRTEAIRRVQETGVKAIVETPASKMPDFALAEGWTQVAQTDAYIYFFDEPKSVITHSTHH